ncbi:MAG: hypothetical protein PF904_00890 [Kiritimatiellae bacterium]|nr:hypothetical protein [Kiritimatiellia bacterium]
MMKLDAEFCEKRCPICTRAREGKPIAVFLQKIEMFLTGGGCPAGKDRQKKYGVKPNEKIPGKKS